MPLPTGVVRLGKDIMACQAHDRIRKMLTFSHGPTAPGLSASDQFLLVSVPSPPSVQCRERSCRCDW